MRAENSRFWSKVSVGWVLIAIIWLAVPQAPGQNKKAWQTGKVTQAKEHQVTSGNTETKQYDVTIKVGKKIYSGLYTMKEGEPDLGWENYVGMERLVLIEGDTLTFNDVMGRPHSLKILSSK